MKSLSSYGTGPKIGLVTLPYLIGSVVLTLLHPSVFTFGVFSVDRLSYPLSFNAVILRFAVLMAAALTTDQVMSIVTIFPLKKITSGSVAAAMHARKRNKIVNSQSL